MRGDVGVNVICAVAGFALLQGMDLVGLFIAQGRGRDIAHLHGAGLIVGGHRRGRESLRAGQEAVDGLAAHDGGGNADGGDLHGIHLGRILVQNHKVGQQTVPDAADLVFQLVLPGGHGGHGQQGLEGVGAVIVVGINHFRAGQRGAVGLARRQGYGGVDVVARAADDLTARVHRRGGGGPGHTGLHAAQLVDGQHKGVVVEAVGLVVLQAPAHGAHIVGAARPLEDLVVALAPPPGVVDVVRVEQVLGLHPRAEGGHVQIVDIGRRVAAALKRAQQIGVHLPGRIGGNGLFGRHIIAGHTLDLLQFHELGVDGGVPGVGHAGVRVVGNRRLHGGHPFLCAEIAVGVGFRAHAVLVVQGDGLLHVFRRGVARREAGQILGVGLGCRVIALGGRMLAPVIVAGALHQRGIALRRAVGKKLVRAQENPVPEGRVQAGGQGAVNQAAAADDFCLELGNVRACRRGI